MSPLEIETVLESFVIIADTREQDTERARKRYKAFSVPVQRAMLDYGDYTYNATLPDGTQIYDIRRKLKPKISVERKMDLDELAHCLGKDRKRFEAEFRRAKEADARMVLVVEDANWENLLNGRYQSRLNPKAFFSSISAWAIRYDLNVLFCKSETSPILIKEILYRDLKERLQNGEFEAWVD